MSTPARTSYPHPIVAREGWPFLAAAVAASLAVGLLLGWGSLALHAACGFRTIGVRERIGQLHGVWRDVVYLERRSPKL